MKTQEIKLAIESRIENVSLIGIAVHSICSKITGNESIASEMEICIVEACNNSIEHSYLSSDSETVEIILRFPDSEIHIEVIDTGLAKDPDIKPVFEFDPNDIENLPEGGMGLFLIESIMDVVEYQSINGKNILTMKKKLT